MRILFLFFFSVLVFKLNGQSEIKSITIRKPVADTINYIYLGRVEGWNIKQILDNTAKSLYNCNKELRIRHPIDSYFLNLPVINPKIKVNEKDTLMSVSWYVTKNNGCVKGRCGHYDYIWRLKLNQKSNVIILDWLYCVIDKKITRLLFKVIKCSEFELILEDMEIKSVKRRYYFQKG